MMRSLYSGVAGLKTHQTGMDVVGNNIANVNTTGFKSFRATYQDTLYQTSAGASQAQNNRGGTNPIQVGLGVGNASIDKMFKDGSVQNTSSPYDLCLSGDGLFIVKDGSGEYYTRNGAFRFDGQGNYVNSAGQFVMGWMGTDGVVNTNAQPGIINIPAGKPMASETTTIATYSNNLNAADPTIVKMTDQNGNAVTGTATIGKGGITSLKVEMSNGEVQTLKSGTYTLGHSLPLTTTLTVYDSLGNAHKLAVTMEKTGTDTDCWEAKLEAPTTLAVVEADTTNKSFVFTNGQVIKRPTSDEYLFNVTASGQDTYLFMNAAGEIERGTVTAGASKIGLTLPIFDAANDTYIYRSATSPYTYTSITAPAGTTILATIAPDTSNDTFVFKDGTQHKVGGTLPASITNTVVAGANTTYTFSDGSSVTVPSTATYDQVSASSDQTVLFSDGTQRTVTAGYMTFAQKIEASSDMDAYVFDDGSVVKVKKGSVEQIMVPASATDTAIFKTTGSPALAQESLTEANATLAREVAPDSRGTVVLSDGKDVKFDTGADVPAAGDFVIVEDDGSITTIEMKAFTTQFKTDGSYDTDNSQIGTIKLTPRNGAAVQTVTVDTSGLTQYSGSNTVKGDCDGHAAGTLTELNFDASGTVVGTYSNGVLQKEAVVAIAQFNNNGGLTAAGSTLFQKSNNSGEPNIKTATDLGCKITPSALEMSNVDLAQEFSTMIVTQRGFQSNSKIITVSDEMLETLIQLKR